MANANKTGGIAILAILALCGLGLSGYMFVEDRFLGGEEYLTQEDLNDYVTEEDLIDYVTEDDLDVYKLVGAWDNLEGSGTVFNLTLLDRELHLMEYFSINLANDTITLLHEGWYKFTLLTTWVNLDSTAYYRATGFKNGIQDYSKEFQKPSATTLGFEFTYYVYSNGTDSIFMQGYSTSDSFGVAANSAYNAAYLEYLVP